MDVNEGMKTKLIPTIKKHFNNKLKGLTIAMWGLSFKPHTDDIREASSLYNIKALLKEGVKIRVHDPESMENVKKLFKDEIEYSRTPYEAAEGADAVLIVTEWPEFRTPDFERLTSI